MTSSHGDVGTIVERAQIALEDEFLRGAVRFTTDRLRSRKQAATEELGQWEEWRERAREIRTHTVANLDFYLGQFATNARAAGAHVHYATDGLEAAATVLQIAKQSKAQLVAKSKSMVSEEIHINHHLAKEGIRAVETDLGEYIIQLAGETPSHIIIPAIHKTREQIRELFTIDGGEELTTETKSLVSFARKRLRAIFQQADIGLTGCNFGIAETGSVVLFTNEGNADLVTALPRIHIVVMGMERIVPTLADLEVMANVLPRSATGQQVITYMSLCTGPRTPQEWDGPEEMHIVVLDNGRSQQLGDPVFQEVLNCIRCGACLNVCPVYRQMGGHAYGSVYPGPIGAVLTPLLQQGEEFEDLPYASSLCGACYEACPVKIPLHDMLVALRQRKVAQGKGGRAERLAFRLYRTVFGQARRYRLAMKVARTVQRPLVQDHFITTQIGPLGGWTRTRHAPALSELSFREQFSNMIQSVADVDPVRGRGEADNE